MKCKHCEYETGYNWVGSNSGELIEAYSSLGNFYKLSVELSRATQYGQDERETLYGCPSCGKVFIDVIGGVTNE